MSGFDAERSYTVYEDYKGFYVKKQNPDKTWQKAYIDQSHLEAFFDNGDQSKIPVNLTEDKYQDEDDLPDDGNYASPEQFSKKDDNLQSKTEPDGHENLIKMEFEELNLGQPDPGPETSTNNTDEHGEENDITRYTNKGILPRIDTRGHHKPARSDVKIFHEKQNWQGAPKVDFRKHYEPSGGNAQIVNERLKWEANPKVDAKRSNYKPQGGNVDILEQKLSWNSKSKVDAINTKYNPKVSDVEIINQKLDWKASPRVEAKSDHKPGGGNVEIINEKLKWDAQAKVGSVTNHVPGGGNIEIPTEKLRWNAVPKVDAKQNDYTPRGGDVQVVSERVQWKSVQKIDAHNKDYQPSGGNVTIIDNPVKVQKTSRTESVNPNYERPTGRAEIVNDHVKWEVGPRIDAAHQDYKPRGGDEVKIVDEKLNWDSKPKIEANNVNYKPKVRDIGIFSEKPKWNAGPKIDSQNQNYTKPERKDFTIHNKKGYDWEKNKPLRKMNSLQNIRWLPVVENVTFDPVKRRWVAATKDEDAHQDVTGSAGESEAQSVSEEANRNANSLSPSVSGSDLTDKNTETSSILSSPKSQQRKKIKKRQTMPELTDRKQDFLYKKKENHTEYGRLMRDRRKDIPMPEELKQAMRDFREQENRMEAEAREAYSKAQEDASVNKRKHSKPANIEVLDMNSLYKYSKGKL